MRNTFVYLSWGAAAASASFIGFVPAFALAQTPLNEVVVQGQSSEPDLQGQGDSRVLATTNASTDKSYIDETTDSATKTNTPVIEIPQSITTVTRKQIDDQNPQTVSDALRYTAGVLSNVDGTSRYDSLFLRGFGGFGQSTDIVDFLDNLKLPRGQGFALPAIDPFLLDRIDVLKGPSALLYGQTSPGGLVNQVSRMPSATSYNEVRVEGGSFDRRQVGITSRGAIDSEGKLQYGISAIGRQSETRYDDVEEERYGIAPAIAWQPNEDTRLTVLGFYQKDPEGGYFNSIFPDFLAPSQFRQFLTSKLNIGDPSFEDYDRTQNGVGYIFEHRFNDVVSFKSRFRHTDLEQEFRGIQMVAPGLLPNGLIPRQAVISIEDVSGFATDNHLRFEFNTGRIEHEVIGGIDIQRSQSDFLFQGGGATPLNILAPQYGQPVGPFFTLLDNTQNLDQTGVYIQDQIKVGGLHVLLGVRHDRTEQETFNRPTAFSAARSVANQSSEETSYRAGALYLFDNGLAPYVSYSTSFEPVVGVDANGNPFDPTTAQQYEAGLKYEPGFADALLTFSAFDITQQNVLTSDPANVNFNVQEGEVRSRGLEFEARGKATRNLEVIAAYTVLDTEVTESTVAANIGKRPEAVPDQFGSLWANFSFDRNWLNGLTIGGGVRYVGGSFADNANTVPAPGYTLFDAALSFDFAAVDPKLQGIEATLNITNIEDEVYFASCSFGFFCQFGNRRRVLAGLRYKW